MAITFSDFFTKMGKLFHYGNITHTAIGTTIEDEVEDFVQQFTTETLQVKETAEQVAEDLQGFQASGAGFLSGSMTRVGDDLLIQMIKADNQQASDSRLESLKELRQQMIDASESLNASTPACTPTYLGANTGNGVIVISTKRGDGLVNEFIFGEDVEGTVTVANADESATLSLDGEEKEGDSFSHLWPVGSGTGSSLISNIGGGGSNLITNGTFKNVNALEADLPKGWIASVETFGTTLKVSDVEVQTVIMSSSPSAGHYLLHWVNADSDSQTTIPIVYNASGAAVQTALRGIVGLEKVTNVQTGTTPNFTNTITFVDVTNPAQLTSTDNTTGGSIAHATSTAASADVVRGSRSVEFDADGAELTTIQVPVSVLPVTQYAFSLLMKADVAPAAGVFTVDLVDGIGGTTLVDEEAVSNSFTIDATALTTSFVHKTGVFRTPLNLTDIVYLRIRISTAVSAGTSVFLDETCLVTMTELYRGGLSASLFTGPTAWDVDDKLTLPVTNDRAGAIHEWMDRVYNLRETDFLLPSDNAGGETILDSLIG